jgi:hypothetical protein
MLADAVDPWWHQVLSVRNPALYFTAAGTLFMYLVYMIVRKRRGARDGHAPEPEI